MLTKDSVTILVDGVVYYRVFNPTMSITKVEDANLATQMLAQTTLRNMLGTKSLADILRDREEMAEQMEVIQTHINFINCRVIHFKQSKTNYLLLT